MFVLVIKIPLASFWNICYNKAGESVALTVSPLYADRRNVMYIVGKTEDGDTLYWGNGRWHESIEDAESFGVMRGHFKMGELEAYYIDDYERYNYRGKRIVSIREY